MTTPSEPVTDPVTEPPADPPAERTFTQAEVDRIVQERALREVRTKYADYDDLKAKAAQFDEVTEKQKTEAEKAVEAARKEGRSEALSAVNERLKRAVVRGEATGKLANPELAEKLLDMSQFTVSDDGDVDLAAVRSAIDELVKKEPYLAAKPAGFQGSDSDGPGGKPSGPKQVTEAEFGAMSPEQRVRAREEGRLTALLGGS